MAKKRENKGAPTGAELNSAKVRQRYVLGTKGMKKSGRGR